MKTLCAKVIGAVAAFAVLLALTGCGSINIIGLAVPAMVEINEGDSTALEVSFSADRENVSDEALHEAAEKLVLEWASSDEDVVTVDENGNVTAVKGGEATITVKSGEIFSTCRVTVRVPLKCFEAESEMSLYINGSIEDIVPSKPLVVGPIPANADDYDPIYTSADESIATVDEDGVVTAVSNGKTTIAVQSGGISTEIEVTVYTAPAFIEVEDAGLYIGRSGELTVTVDDEDVTFSNPLTYASSDEDVCKVDEDGVISGISEGEATITVSNGTGVTGTATITVNPAPVARPAVTGSNAGNADSTGAAGTAGGDPAAPAPAPAAPAQSGCTCYTGDISHCVIHGTPCRKCGVKGHDIASCPQISHYHGNGYDMGWCECGTGYVPYLAGDAVLPEGNAWE